MSKLTCWDFTLKFGDNYDDKFKLGKALSEICKEQSTFQLEKSLTGYEHWQGRVITKKQFRVNEIIKIGQEEFLRGIHWSPTTNHNKGNMTYVTKDYTRVEGPYIIGDFNKVLTRQLREFYERQEYEWQESIRLLATSYNDRKIDIVYCEHGNNGKSIFAEALEFEGITEEIPPYRLMDDIFAWVFGRPKKKCYIVDMPRGMKKEKLADFYAGLEVLKNGVCYDKRYSARKIRFDRPRVIVFTNGLPMFNLMSADRWSVWAINRDKELVRYNVSFDD